MKCLWPYLVPLFLQPPSVMAFPATTPTGMMGYGMVSAYNNGGVRGLVSGVVIFADQLKLDINR